MSDEVKSQPIDDNDDPQADPPFHPRGYDWGMYWDDVPLAERQARSALGLILATAYDVDGVLFDSELYKNYQGHPHGKGYCYADQKERFPDGAQIHTSMVVNVKDECPSERVHPSVAAFGIATTLYSRYILIPSLWSDLTGYRGVQEENAKYRSAQAEGEKSNGYAPDARPEVRAEADAGTEGEGRPDEAPQGS